MLVVDITFPDDEILEEPAGYPTGSDGYAGPIPICSSSGPVASYRVEALGGSMTLRDLTLGWPTEKPDYPLQVREGTHEEVDLDG